eukprot:TRINITY_DN17825_c0_g1_i1.p1 TRINITY_DN17825_c0_g1~~TRINITY_DN17825_c0_g1_i1.p1  ORF type:complete len:140 (+),score=37.89 TRINITY_DN17825_c0_g1_i1:42-422(+)
MDAELLALERELEREHQQGKRLQEQQIRKTKPARVQPFRSTKHASCPVVCTGPALAELGGEHMTWIHRRMQKEEQQKDNEKNKAERRERWNQQQKRPTATQTELKTARKEYAVRHAAEKRRAACGL